MLSTVYYQYTKVFYLSQQLLIYLYCNIQPSIDMLLKISDFYGVTTDYLLGRDDKKYICADHLTDDEIAHINQIIKDITKNR